MKLRLAEKLITTPIAHRGLWSESVPENSIVAFKRAVENGYPIEIDLYITIDGEIVVFHDNNLFRMTGVDNMIYNCDYIELKNLRLANSEYSIPTLQEVLKVVDKKVPLLIELKDQPNNEYVEKVVDILKDYDGEFAIQSFNPFYLIKLKKLAPNIARGVLGTDEKLVDKGSITRWVVRKMPFNFIIKPHFISYRKNAILKGKIKKKSLPLFAWTITSSSEQKQVLDKATNIIFENFIPE